MFLVYANMMCSLTEGTSQEKGGWRKKDWLNRCIKKTISENFPDGGQLIEGGIFIRNEASKSPPPPPPRQSKETPVERTALETVDAKPVEIKAPATKRIPGWLSFFYPSSSASASSPPASNATVKITTSPNTSDVEIEPIAHHRLTPPSSAAPKKGILKPSKAIQPTSFLDEELPRPIENKFEFLQQERERAQMFEQIEEHHIITRARKVAFSEQHSFIEVHSKEDYNRSAIDYVARALTPAIAMMIKKELNEVKTEMEVHDSSKHHTQFYQVK
jgi:hypothetical protein